MSSHKFAVSPVLALGIAVAAAAPAAAFAATASATATASASAKVGRAAQWKNGKSITVKKSGSATKSGQVRYRGSTKAELSLRKAGLLALQGSAKKQLEVSTKAAADAKVRLDASAKARASAEAKFSAAKSAYDKATVDLKAKVKARASAEAELKTAKSEQAKLSAKSSFSFDLSFGGKKKKADARVKTADENVKKTKADEKKAQDKVTTTKKNQDGAQKDLDTAKNTETEAKNDVAQEQANCDESKETIEETTEEVAEIDEELAETPAPGETEPVVVAPPPTTPPDNVFGYEKPVWGCFEGNVMFIEPNSPKLPTDYSKYEVSSRIYACEWDIPVRSFDAGFPGVADKFEWFAIVYSGMFNVSQPGIYQFRINSDDGTKLFIDGKPVVNNDGTHPPQSVTGAVELTAGDHELVLEYFQGPRYHIALQVWVTPPGAGEQIFSVR